MHSRWWQRNSLIGLISLWASSGAGQAACNLATAASDTLLSDVRMAAMADCLTDLAAENVALGAALDKAVADALALQVQVDGFAMVLKEAVIAFNRSEKAQACPTGWSLFEPAGGRVIVGAGQHTSAGVSEYPSYLDDMTGSRGGAQSVVLKIPNMPAHTHRISTDFDRSDIHDGLAGGSLPARQDKGILDTFKDLPDAPNWPRVLPDVLETTGKGDAFAIVPPYVALYYCKKD